MTTVRIHLAIPLLAESFDAVPDGSGQLVDVGRVDGATYRLLVRVSLADEARFEAALGEDETVVAWTRLTTGEADRLYRVRVGADRLAVRAYRHALQLDGYLVAARVDADGWHLRLLFPDRAAVSSFTDRCASDGMDPTVRAIQRTERSHGGPAYDHTRVQAETLRLAIEAGYFDVPRHATLETLADEMGVSKQAVSERLRRGLRSLLAGTVAAPSAAAPMPGDTK